MIGAACRDFFFGKLRHLCLTATIAVSSCSKINLRNLVFQIPQWASATVSSSRDGAAVAAAKFIMIKQASAISTNLHITTSDCAAVSSRTHLILYL